jgi:nucleotide-binding universal stress UspA family protein
MLTFNRILLASDVSASAEAALLYAATLARQSQARLFVMHVVETGVAVLPHWTDVFRSSEVFAAHEAAQTASFEKLVAHPALQGLPVEACIQRGHALTLLADMAAEVDLLVMGVGEPVTEKSREADVLACRLAHAGAAPVLLVPSEGGTAGLPAADADRLPVQRLLLALDLAKYAPQACDVAQALMADYAADLTVLQVLDPDTPADYPIDAGNGMHHNLPGLQVMLEKQLSVMFPDALDKASVTRAVVTGSPVEVIRQHVATQQPDMLIMSAHTHSIWRKYFRLSTIDALLSQPPCPILAVPIPHA